MSIKKEFYTWLQFEDDTRKIADWARGKNFASIYGIPRGGLVPAVLLSHILDLPIIMIPESIDDQTLVIDDISDTGNTILALEKRLSSKLIIATLFFHKDTKRMSDFCVREKKEWVVFPWETEASSKYDNSF